MPAFFQGRKIMRMGALTEPSTYDADITPADMQLGTTAYANGEKVIGTGKAFEFALYGRLTFSEIADENGEMKYGGEIFAKEGTNILFVSPYTGDLLIQNNIFVSPIEDIAVKIGENKTTGGHLYIFRKGEKVCIYSTEAENTKTKFYYFIAKDNYL